MKLPRIFGFCLALLSLAILGLAQQKDSKATKQKQDSAQSKQKQASQPLFKNRLGFTSSQSTKESTTLAFNGVDPSGKVDQEMLAKVPSAENRSQVQAMASTAPSPAELKAFLQEGGLKKK